MVDQKIKLKQGLALFRKYFTDEEFSASITNSISSIQYCTVNRELKEDASSLVLAMKHKLAEIIARADTYETFSGIEGQAHEYTLRRLRRITFSYPWGLADGKIAYGLSYKDKLNLHETYSDPHPLRD